MGVGAADPSSFSGSKPVECSLDPWSWEMSTRHVGFKADDDRGIGRRSAEKLGSFANQNRKHLIWIEISDLKR